MIVSCLTNPINSIPHNAYCYPFYQIFVFMLNYVKRKTKKKSSFLVFHEEGKVFPYFASTSLILPYKLVRE